MRRHEADRMVMVIVYHNDRVRLQHPAAPRVVAGHSVSMASMNALSPGHPRL